MAAGDHYLSRSNEALCVSREFFFSLGNCAWTNKTKRSSESSTDKRGVERGKEKTWNGSENSQEKPIPLFKLKRSCYKREGISNEKKKGICVCIMWGSVIDRYLDTHRTYTRKSFELLNAILDERKTFCFYKKTFYIYVVHTTMFLLNMHSRCLLWIGRN